MPHVIVHTLAETCAAMQASAELQSPLTLHSPPNASRSLGVGYFLAMIESARRQVPAAKSLAVLDCGTAPGLALAALKAGAEGVRLACSPHVMKKVAEIATQSGASLFLDLPHDIIDLGKIADPLAATRALLGGASVIEPPQNS